jgi:hypothetical protein
MSDFDDHVSNRNRSVCVAVASGAGAVNKAHGVRAAITAPPITRRCLQFNRGRRAILFSDAAAMVTGHVLAVDGGWLAP